MAEIFDQPMRANAAVLQRAGAGRLFIAREMTLEHRGTIAVPSVGGGTTLTVTLSHVLTK